MKVKVLSYTNEPEKVIASAAKLCYSNKQATEIFDNLTDEEVERMTNMLNNLGHESPFEHVSFTFAIEGVSRALTHQLVRHRIASYSQQSQRYINFNNFDYYIPDIISKNEETKKCYERILENIRNGYKELETMIYEDALKEEIMKEIHVGRRTCPDYDVDGLDLEYFSEENQKRLKSSAHKIANENARYILPNAATSNIVVTMNVRSLWNFFDHRCCHRAQEEINKLAFKMFNEVKQIAPNLFKEAMPCKKLGYCKENNMQCSDLKNIIPTKQELIKKFNNKGDM